MTLPVERAFAVHNTRNFLRDLCTPQEIKGIPSAVRRQARELLRHYPSDLDMSMVYALAPHIFTNKDDFRNVDVLNQYSD